MQTCMLFEFSFCTLRNLRYFCKPSISFAISSCISVKNISRGFGTTNIPLSTVILRQTTPYCSPQTPTFTYHTANPRTNVMENIEKLGQVLDGKLIAGDIQKNITQQVTELREQSNVVPGLAIVQVGDRSDSNVYIRMKTKTAAEVGINAQHVRLGSDTSEKELLQKIDELNADPAVHGIILQLPLDCKNPINASKATDAISAQKDVDGLTTMNAGHLARGELKSCTIPCTPRGCLELIKRSGVKIEGSRAVVLGRSKIVGSPMAELLIWHHATVTVCHSKTVDLPAVIREADILVVAIGKAKFVQSSWIKPGAVVIDCGINVIPDSSLKSGQRIVGDVDYAAAKDTASFITPVPGGVGPMTVAMLLQNTLESAQKSSKL
ncbi:C-1-tetrahydrofolate synthase, cytoplasmic-like [Paramacrobiotus metropolitanus]|uniref:C-1-tetrahydrofolate synthase, cytoplasmic-like n=1 Tax=Paramacrobiotus metropolitanus TaxID=2943436 RepID=UPI0024458DBE|nr:C-1-tetrahydrofolate synthase, cytoplasmic-like [Paramacrobiotus metropolitanus]